MVRDLVRPMESARKRAERRWGNHRVATKYKANKAETKAAPPKPQEPLLIVSEKPKNDILTKTQERFKKEIRKMLDEHKEQNRALYIAGMREIIARVKRKLVLEKLRRLEASNAAREGQSNG